MLLMKHPDLPDTEPAVTTQAAFDKVWSKKGWQKVEPETVEVERSRPGNDPAAESTETEQAEAPAAIPSASRRAKTSQEG